MAWTLELVAHGEPEVNTRIKVAEGELAIL